tara:strand:+ start:191 stop:736 length:546 start_codon:yes stop_codon:yes gene_type:complete
MTNLFLRHAEVLNKKNIQYANLPGFQISDHGEEQSIAAGKLLKKSNNKIQKIITSPLLRARETSSIISEILKIPIIFSNNLTEWNGISNWIGKTLEEIKASQEYLEKKTSLDLNPVDETLKSVYKRVEIEYKNNENTLFVSHQDTIRAFTYFFTNDQDFAMYRPENCEIQFIKNNIVRTLT